MYIFIFVRNFCINFILFVLKFSLFVLSQSKSRFLFQNTRTSIFYYLDVGAIIDKEVSSANRKCAQFLLKGMILFIYNINNNGLKHFPWGTPAFLNTELFVY